ncbi:MAG: GntR family transcriptional regulator [Lentisphaeria bacterium]|nr:GntR family transcriptional regulator [Lentisphaeria bacterium]
MSCRYANAKYMTIADLITKRLRAGEFSADGRFYSRDELARAYHISPGTARSVFRILEDRGVIACRKGKRPLPADVMPENYTSPVCNPIFFRDSLTAETPEYDYLVYCVRNMLMRRKLNLREHTPDLPDLAEYSAGDVAVVFSLPCAENTLPNQMPARRPTGAQIEVLFDQPKNNSVSLFTRKAGLDCTLYLIRHNITSVFHITSRHSAFPWFKHGCMPSKLREYIPECNVSSIVFDDDPEMFPGFLMDSVPVLATSNHAPVAILIDDPFLSDFLSAEIRVGTYRVPSRCLFFGTAFNERTMAFPYLDLKLNELAATLLRTVSAKAENPAADLACDLHLVQFRNPGVA